MSNKSVSVDSNSGILPALLTVLFVGLKLTHYIDWSWWWVLSPLWISAAIALAFGAVVLVIVSLTAGRARKSRALRSQNRFRY